jgi:hypothetical protein
MGLTAVAISVLVFLIVLTVYGQVDSALNKTVFSTAVQNLINQIPLVLVGAALIAIVVAAMRFVQ